MKQIPLVNSEKLLIVDDALYPELVKHRWSLQSGGYVRTWVGIKMIYIHRMVTGVEKGKYVDHINGDKLDNRKQNLRICTQSENLANSKKRKNTSSIYKGVNWDESRGKFLARIGVNGTGINLGRFDTDVEAAQAYNDAAIKYYGEFANLNKI